MDRTENKAVFTVLSRGKCPRLPSTGAARRPRAARACLGADPPQPCPTRTSASAGSQGSPRRPSYARLRATPAPSPGRHHHSRPAAGVHVDEAYQGMRRAVHPPRRPASPLSAPPPRPRHRLPSTAACVLPAVSDGPGTCALACAGRACGAGSARSAARLVRQRVHGDALGACACVRACACACVRACACPSDTPCVGCHALRRLWRTLPRPLRTSQACPRTS